MHRNPAQGGAQLLLRCVERLLRLKLYELLYSGRYAGNSVPMISGRWKGLFLLQGFDLVAEVGGALEFESFGGGEHLSGQLRDQRLLVGGGKPE